MLAKTLGQPASPNRLGLEIRVFIYRLRRQLELLDAADISGNICVVARHFGAHRCAFSDVNWIEFEARYLSVLPWSPTAK